MILDSYKLSELIVQLRYNEAFELWDSAGRIARALSKIWTDLKTVEGQPAQQVLKGDGVQINTGFTQSTVTFTGGKGLDQRAVQQLKETYDIWREHLDLQKLTRVSTRAKYVREYESMRQANEALVGFNAVKWPSAKVFDQPTDSDLNAYELTYRFEDAQSFAFLRLKTESIKMEASLDPTFFEDPKLISSKHWLVIDFDRGMLGNVEAHKFRMEDWLRGFQHVLRRDLEKVISAP